MRTRITGPKVGGERHWSVITGVNGEDGEDTLQGRSCYTISAAECRKERMVSRMRWTISGEGEQRLNGNKGVKRNESAESGCSTMASALRGYVDQP